MASGSARALLEQLRGMLELHGDQVRIVDEQAFRMRGAEVLARASALGADEEGRKQARALARAAAGELGVYPASIHALYLARGRGEVPAFTAPAMNVRALTFDTVRAAFRAAQSMDAGAFLFEIARSEIAYTEQRPAEYTTSVLCAALREGHVGPVFIQGDHFQVNAKKYAANPEGEVGEVKKLIVEGIAGGFYNIDVDTSTLVDLSLPTLSEQQRTNGRRCAELTALIRSLEPKGCTISVGGEIGEVGGQNSDVHEFRAFMGEYLEALRDYGARAGISKISIQTGTSHGGVPLPDGSIAQVQIDFEALRTISAVARAEYGLGGAVQHGASTLPAAVFDRFPDLGTVEIHLATEFQNMVYDHPSFPAELREEMFGWLRTHAADERKPADTEEQFLYKTRKKALGPFKRRMWDLPESTRDAIAGSLEAKFKYLFGKLSLAGTRASVQAWVTRPEGEAALVSLGRAEDDLEGE